MACLLAPLSAVSGHGLEQQGKEYGKADDPRAWADLCHVLFNVKEFIFLN